MRNATNIASARRFRDELAISACDHENGATVYLSLKQAKQMRAAISKIIRSIERENFSASSGLSFTTSTRDKRYTQAAYIERKAGKVI